MDRIGRPRFKHPARAFPKEHRFGDFWSNTDVLSQHATTSRVESTTGIRSKSISTTRERFEVVQHQASFLGVREKNRQDGATEKVICCER